MRPRLKRLKLWLSVDKHLWSKLDLLKALVQRDLEAKYRGSILGNFWPLIQQVAQLLIYTYVFSIVLKVRLSGQDFPGGDRNFAFGLWLFAGLIPWLTFMGAALLRVRLQDRAPAGVASPAITPPPTPRAWPRTPRPWPGWR
ncbi:MAG: ABC transporter permease, partial [Leptolyngbya sp. SIO4C1]|nr:ABC transporter permease [Leptolyngbya sp. SIO4C1]